MDPELTEWLVRGDELVARGDPRGELMIVQCELERGLFDRTRGIHLRKRERELLHEAIRDCGPIFERRQPTFRRGVIDTITIAVTDFVRDEEAIWKAAPYLRHVRFDGLRYDSKQQGGPIDPKGWDVMSEKLEAALASGHVTSFCPVDSHVVWNCNAAERYDDDYKMERIDDQLTSWLIETKRISTLRGLELIDQRPSILESLARAPTAEGLVELRLGQPAFAVACPDSLLSALETTRLAPKRVVFPVAMKPRLLASPFLARVTDLQIGRLASFEDFSVGSQLRVVDTTVSTDDGWLESLTNCTGLSNVEELVLRESYEQRDPIDYRPLYEPKRLNALRALRIKRSISVEAVAELLASPLGRQLEQLEVAVPWGADTDNALQALAWDGFLERTTNSYPSKP